MVGVVSCCDESCQSSVLLMHLVTFTRDFGDLWNANENRPPPPRGVAGQGKSPMTLQNSEILMMIATQLRKMPQFSVRVLCNTCCFSMKKNTAGWTYSPKERSTGNVNCVESHISSLLIPGDRKNIHIWVFPKIGVGPPNHPFVHRVFHEINHPFWGTSIFGSTPI